MTEQVLVVSIDGVAPRFVSPRTMPHLCALGLEGASSYQAETVHPSITLPAHASLLRGVDPRAHGITNNTPKPLDGVAPSFLRIARSAGLTTAAVINWTPIRTLLEPDAVDTLYFLDRGYGADDDSRIATSARRILEHESPDLVFVYIVAPDLAGHDHGWGSPEYLQALVASDNHLASVVNAAGPDRAIIVTTDHGGEGDDHQASRDIDKQTFVTLRSARVPCGTTWTRRPSILDVAPTVASLLGFPSDSGWTGRSLVHDAVPIASTLIATLESMGAVSYGEQLSMLEHSLQTAQLAQQASASDDQIAAALLHDVGHLLGAVSEWGYADHATAGANYLQQWFSQGVVEPIRLHVEAKRTLVAAEPDYHASLSHASQQSLLEQGGPHTAMEVEAFHSNTFAPEALALRRWDDAGKSTALVANDAPENYRALFERVLTAPRLPAEWFRDACVCAECRDSASGQRLISSEDLDGWVVIGRSEAGVRIRHNDGTDHLVIVEPTADLHLRAQVPVTSGADLRNSARAASDIESFRSSLALHGIALATDLAPESGSVVAFAQQFGLLRETNYGRHFDVVNKPNPNNLAYSARGLPLHTDNPYRDPVPMVQVLHCLISASPQGRSIFADGRVVAEQLRVDAPHHFATLASTTLDFVFEDNTVRLAARHPIIECDAEGSVVAVRVNHRSMQPPDPSSDVRSFYDAYRAFHDAMEEHTFGLDLLAGDVIAFDNRVMLHARGPFDAGAGRHLQGCYIDPPASS